jgi:hypothetical protein
MNNKTEKYLMRAFLICFGWNVYLLAFLVIGAAMGMAGAVSEWCKCCNDSWFKPDVPIKTETLS